MVDDRDRIASALLALRLGVFVVMLAWTLDKFVNAQHAGAVFERFYGLAGVGPAAFRAIGAAELVLVVGFVAGYRKRVTYGLVLILHALSTVSAYQQYLDPFKNLLFFAAIPMLAACYTLYRLRDLDTRWSVD
jgi:hypothetical protein